MKSPLVAALEDFRNILGLCPRCGEIFRLTDIQISYRARPRRTWLDKFEADEARIQRAEERWEQRERATRDLWIERGRQQLPKLLKKADPIFSPRGFFPQDAKPVFDPVDFVIFDGMNKARQVRRVVLFDGPPDDSARERVQHSIERAVKAGNYEWRTVRMGKDGAIRG